MTDFNPDDINPDRLRAIITSAVNGLDPADRADRTEWCRQHDAHGVRMLPSDDDNLVEFRWGNQPLALVPLDVLTSDEPVVGEFVPEVPDTIAELDDDDSGD